MIDQYPPANGVLTSLIWRKTAAGGETSLSGYDNASQALSYTPGQEQVYLNGILLVRGDDYTATNGTSITGLAALSASDFVQINCYNNFSVASLPTSGLVGEISNSQITSLATSKLTGTITNAQLAGSISNDKLSNSSITINGSAVSLGGSATIAGGSAQDSEPTSPTEGQLWLDTNGTLATTAFTEKSTLTTTGDIYYASAANTPARLAIGSTDQVLKVSGGVPTWAAPAAGALTKISTQTFSGVSSVTFDSVFTSTYKVYFVTMTNLIMSNSGLSSFQFRKAGTTTTASYYGSGIYLPFNYSGYEPAKVFNANDSKISVFGADNRSGGGHLYASNVGSGAGDEPMIWGSGTPGFGWGMQSFGGANGSATTDFDGFIISVTGTMSGTLTVYGVQA